MSKYVKNKEIIKLFENRIAKKGYAGRLELDPIENAFKRRQHIVKDNDGNVTFTAFLWQLNELDGDELEQEIDSRIDEAARYLI